MSDFPQSGGGGYNQRGGAQTAGQSRLTQFTMGNGTKGAWQQLLASADVECNQWVLSVQDLINAPGPFLVDVGIGAGPTVVLPDLMFGGNFGSAATTMAELVVPLKLPEGESISIRGQRQAGGTANMRAAVSIMGATFQDIPAPQVAVAYGVSGGGGVEVDSGGTANTKGAWVQIVAATTRPHRWLKLCVAGDGNAGGDQDFLCDVGLGAAPVAPLIIADQYVRTNFNTWEGPMHLIASGGPFYRCDIPEGSEIRARSQCTSATANQRQLEMSVVCI